MELKKIEKKQIANTIEKALLSTKVRETPQADLYRTITAAISKAFADSGQSFTEKDLTYLVIETSNEVKDLFPSLRVDEIPVAIKNGIREEYGEYFGLNIKSFSQFFKAYLESQKKSASSERTSKITTT